MRQHGRGGVVDAVGPCEQRFTARPRVWERLHRDPDGALLLLALLALPDRSILRSSTPLTRPRGAAWGHWVWSCDVSPGTPEPPTTAGAPLRCERAPLWDAGHRTLVSSSWSRAVLFRDTVQIVLPVVRVGANGTPSPARWCITGPTTLRGLRGAPLRFGWTAG